MQNICIDINRNDGKVNEVVASIVMLNSVIDVVHANSKQYSIHMNLENEKRSHTHIQSIESRKWNQIQANNNANNYNNDNSKQQYVENKTTTK